MSNKSSKQDKSSASKPNRGRSKPDPAEETRQIDVEDTKDLLGEKELPGSEKETRRPKRVSKKQQTVFLKDFGFANRIPVMPLLTVVVFPGHVLSFIVRKEHNIQLLEEAGESQSVMCLVGQRPDSPEKPEKLSHLYPVGVAARLIHKMNLPDGSVQVAFQGLARCMVTEIVQTDPYMRAQIRAVPGDAETKESAATTALMGQVMELFEQVVETNPSYSNELIEVLKANIDGPGGFADMIATFIALPLPAKNQLLAELDPKVRLQRLAEYLDMELKKSAVQADLQKQVKVEIEKSQREYILRQQMAAIRRELGEGDDQAAEAARLRERMEKAGLPEQARAKAEEEIRRLETVSPASAEFAVIRTYVDWLVSLPWQKASEDRLDLKHARKVLDDGHFGLKEVKDRIIEFLAVLKLRGEAGGSILCLQGPPGVGKTSLGAGIAEALGRQFQRISVGGLRDDSELMGHRRTYVGAMPGKIIDAMKRAGTTNPLIMIDEIDKMGSDFRGDPASAMLEILDPAQNASFRDRYIDMPYDLSKVLFICTSNVRESIPRPLLDRMEMIDLPSYTRQEKFEIAKRHLVTRQLKANGLKPDNVTFSDDGLIAIIDGHTRESGVRGLERVIGQVCRKVAVAVTSGVSKQHRVDTKTIEDYLGPPKITRDPRLAEAEVGVVTGLAWTAVGGELLFIEATRYPGKGGLKVTGQLGDVMKESVQAALSFVRANADSLGIELGAFDAWDVHVHFPEGATPKDGPSAGVAITTVLTSLMTEKPVRPDVAMTGEVTLRGRVLKVGGVREKVLAAHRAGIRRVLLPKDNIRDVEELPPDVLKEMTFVPCTDVRTNLQEAIIDIVIPREGMKSKLIPGTPVIADGKPNQGHPHG